MVNGCSVPVHLQDCFCLASTEGPRLYLTQFAVHGRGIQHAVQRRPADPQQLRRAQFISAASAQDFDHMLLHHIVQANQPRWLGFVRSCGPGFHQREQVTRLDQGAFRKRGGLRDHAFQLA